MEAGLPTSNVEKPASLVTSAVEVNSWIRASPKIPIVHAGPALGLQARLSEYLATLKRRVLTFWIPQNINFPHFFAINPLKLYVIHMCSHLFLFSALNC